MPKCLGAWALGCMVALCLAQGARAQQLPPGPGADVFKNRCLICHEADIVTQQKLSLSGWTNSVAKMIRWGSQITPEEREVLQPYLAAHFSPKPAVSHPASADAAAGKPDTSAGAATYKRACLSCHDADIIEQQKLSRAGWTNSINKMVRWGAAVPEAERAGLADYLFSRFPPR